MTARRRRALIWAGLAPVGLAIGAMWWLMEPFEPLDENLVHIAIFVLAAAVTEFLPMRQPGARPVATSVAIVGTVALLGASPLVVAVVAALGWLVARGVEREPLEPGTLALRALGGWTLAGVAALGASLSGQLGSNGVVDGGTVASLDLGAAVAATFAIIVGIPALQAMVSAPRRLIFLPRRVVEAVASTWMVGAAIASTALLGALVHDVLGVWTLPTMLIPLLAARFGLERFAVAARAYDQTIRAMSRLPEQLGAVTAEHGVRTARLARKVGLELGLDADTLADLEHAAHLHELGRIRHDDPRASLSREQLAVAGASIVRETDSLSRVAGIIEAHGRPQTAHGEMALPARIVAACCEVDHYDPVPGDAGQEREVLVRLVRDVGDLEVVSAISRVLQREAAAS